MADVTDTVGILAQSPFAEWGNLSALGCLIALVLWFATKGLPGIMRRWGNEAEKARLDFKEVITGAFEESHKQREDFKAESATQRAEFRAESLAQRTAFESALAEQRDQSAQLAISGHNAVNGLAGEIRELRRGRTATGT